MTDGDEILPSDLGAVRSPVMEAPTASLAQYRTLQEFKDRTERQFILEKLKENDWNISATAKAIDTPRSNLYKKLEQYGLSKRGADGDPEAENPGGVAAE